MVRALLTVPANPEKIVCLELTLREAEELKSVLANAYDDLYERTITEVHAALNDLL